MARPTNRLTDTWLKRAKIDTGVYGDGAGLYLRVDGGSRRWIYIYSDKLRKRREMGLGGYPAVSLKEARDRASDARKLRAEGRDPIETKRQGAVPQVETIAPKERPTFEQVAREWIEVTEAEWTAPSIATKYRGYLVNWTFTINALDVAAVDNNAIANLLRPCWGRPLGKFVRSFIERVLEYAMVRGVRPEGRNPARLKGNIDKLVKAPRHKTRHHAALPWKDIPPLLVSLSAIDTSASRALRFIILTASRLNEVRLLRWREVEDDRVTIEAERYKTRREHTIPLTDAARSLLGARGEPDALVFVGVRGGPISEHVIGAALPEGVVPHGFRSTFVLWAKAHRFSPDDADRCLGHVVGTEVRRTYLRDDFFDDKRALLDAWATFATSSPG